MSNPNKEIWVNLMAIWENSIIDAIENNEDYIDFNIMPLDEFKQECIDLITYYFENEMLGNEINYNNIVIDTAQAYEMLKGA